MVSSTTLRSLLASALLFSGASAACSKYIQAQKGDTCASLAQAASITVGQMINSNPGIVCSALVAGNYYCIEGTADSAPTTSSSAAPTQPTSGLKVSTDGNCGSGVTCQGSVFGNCCSAYGFCGSTSDHCLGNCQSAFGSCGAGAISSASTPGTSPTITAPPAGSVTVTVTSVVAITRTALVTSTTTITNTVGQTQTARTTETVRTTVVQTSPATVTATTYQTVRTIVTVTNTIFESAPATATVTQTLRTTQTVLTTNTLQVTRTVEVPVTVTDSEVVTLTTIKTSFETLTSIRTSTLTTTTTRTVQTIVPVTETLTSILTTISTRIVTAVVTTGICGGGVTLVPTPTRPILVTTTQAGGGKPTQTLPGTPANCRNYAIVESDDTCRKIATRYDLTLLDFYALNPSVSKNNIIGGLLCTLDLLLSGLCQINCDALWEGWYVCVGK